MPRPPAARRSPAAGTPPIRPRPPARPLRGFSWLRARSALAARRTRSFARWWLTLGGAVTVVALLMPVGTPDPVAAERSQQERRAADTLRSGAALRRARDASARADSSLAVLERAIADRPRSVAAPRPQSDARSAALVASLDAALGAARRERSVQNVLAVSNDPAVASGPRMRALADTLARAADALEQSPLSESADRTGQQATVRRLSNTILAIAQFRRDAVANATPAAGADAAPSRDDEPARDTVALADARLLSAAWRDSVASAQRAYDAAVGAVVASASAVRAGAPTHALSPGIILLAVLVGGLSLRFALALSREARAPRLAHVEEAEAAVGAPVLAVVRDALPDGPMRFRPSGVDPFRVLYLGLTATGTRARTLVVTGSDPVVLGAVGARLAIAAAADHRTTLVMDLDPEQITLARIFRAPPEPGFTDAMAGAFKWKEVARPVGSSDGLAITMVAAGTTRDSIEESETTATRRAEFSKFRDVFEFTIVVASLRDLAHAMALVPSSPVVLCATLGVTDMNEYEREGSSVTETAGRLHGIVLWDAPSPALPSRAELAAHLSKQKGRTPGGSFQAVKKIVQGQSGDTNKPL